MPAVNGACPPLPPSIFSITICLRGVLPPPPPHVWVQALPLLGPQPQCEGLPKSEHLPGLTSLEQFVSSHLIQLPGCVVDVGAVVPSLIVIVPPFASASTVSVLSSS